MITTTTAPVCTWCIVTMKSLINLNSWWSPVEKTNCQMKGWRNLSVEIQSLADVWIERVTIVIVDCTFCSHYLLYVEKQHSFFLPLYLSMSACSCSSDWSSKYDLMLLKTTNQVGNTLNQNKNILDFYCPVNITIT
jgi:hypothetical protein